MPGIVINNVLLAFLFAGHHDASPFEDNIIHTLRFPIHFVFEVIKSQLSEN
jgi:hypothetical protein